MAFIHHKGKVVMQTENSTSFLKEIKRPTRFHLPTIQMITSYEPTDRYILWIIANAPYAFNVFYFGQFAMIHPDKITDKETPLNKALETLRSLRIKHLIKQNKDSNWEITWKGSFVRLTSHPNFNLMELLFGACITITVFILNRSPSTKEIESREKEIGKEKIYDSSLKSSHPVQMKDTATIK